MAEAFHPFVLDVVAELERASLHLGPAAMRRWHEAAKTHVDAETIITHLVVLAVRFIREGGETAAEQLLELAAAAMSDGAEKQNALITAMMNAGADLKTAQRVVGAVRFRRVTDGLAEPGEQVAGPTGVKVRGK